MTKGAGEGPRAFWEPGGRKQRCGMVLGLGFMVSSAVRGTVILTRVVMRGRKGLQERLERRTEEVRITVSEFTVREQKHKGAD